MPDRERKRVPDDRSVILKGSLPKNPPAHFWDMENPRVVHVECPRNINRLKKNMTWYDDL